jgi:hypothetical protein
MTNNHPLWMKRFLLVGLVAGALPALCAMLWFVLYLYLGVFYLRRGDSQEFVAILTREEYVRWFFLAAAIILGAWFLALRAYRRRWNQRG